MKTYSLIALLALTMLGGAFQNPLFAQTPLEELEKKKEAIDFSDAEQVFEVGAWAIKNKNSKVRREGRKLLKEVIDMDDSHAGAHTALGHILWREVWYDNRKDLAKARKKILGDEMKAKGYIWFKNGWLKKADKRKYNKKWEKDDNDVWMSYEEVMKKKGYVLYKGEWLKINDQDMKRMETHRKMTGDDILVISTEHFRFHLGVPIKYAKEYSEKLEAVYAWYMKEFEVPQQISGNVFGRRAEVWTFTSPQQFQDWVTTYSLEYEFSDESKKAFRDSPSGWLLFNERIITAVAEKAEDLDNRLCHQAGSLCLAWHTRIGGKMPSWLNEAVGHMAEHLFANDKYGHTNCSTKAKYSNGGGIAAKEFNTKDCKPRTKSIVKAGDDIGVLELSKLPLNQLSGDHLSQGYSMTEWLYNGNRKELAAFVAGLSAYRGDVAKAIKEGVKSAPSVTDFERAWRKYVKAKYR